MITLDDLTGSVIILLVIMIAAFIMSIMSVKLSSLINKKHPGNYSLAIKTVGLIIVTICSITIILILRG